MKVFDNKHIKNVVFVGAHHAGKTTLAETMLFEAGLINRRGTVEQQNTVSDYHDIEHERGASVFATPLHTEWRNYKINIIDTPGLDDFIGEIIASIRVADTIVQVINAEHGADIGTEIIWDYVNKYHKPTVFVINKIDHEKANFDQSLASLKRLVGNNAVQIQYPIILDGAQCIVDVLKMKCYKFGPEGGKPEKLAIPDNELERATAQRIGGKSRRKRRGIDGIVLRQGHPERRRTPPGYQTGHVEPRPLSRVLPQCPQGHGFWKAHGLH